jgi:hypothetical protein
MADQVDLSVLEPLARIRQQEAAVRGYLERADQARPSVSDAVYRKVAGDYARRLASLEQQAAALVPRVRQEYQRLLHEYEALAGPEEAARLEVEELQLRHDVGEMVDHELAERQRAPRETIERCAAQKEALDRLKAHFLEVLGADASPSAVRPVDAEPLESQPSEATLPPGPIEPLPAIAVPPPSGPPPLAPVKDAGHPEASLDQGMVPTLLRPAAPTTFAPPPTDAQTAFVPLGFLTIEQGPGAPAEAVLGDRTYIGRGEDCQLRIPHPTVSRHHAVVVAGADGFCIRDLGSQNGTLVNGQPAADRPLADNDLIRVGEAAIIFSHKSRLRAE